MKQEFMYERRQTADRMEAIMVGVSVVAVLAAIFAFFRGGWLPGVSFLILASIAFGLSRIFDLLGDLFASTDRSNETTKAEKEK
jgi:hypothetical protein